MRYIALAAWAVLTFGGSWLLWWTVPDAALSMALAFMWGIFAALVSMFLWSWLSGRST